MWHTLTNSFRPVVVSALCQLFELASEVDSESRHANKVSWSLSSCQKECGFNYVSCIYKVFKITALKYLWSCALSNVSGIASIISITVVNLISLFSTLIFCQAHNKNCKMLL